jgi:hypothetical protein
MVRRKFGDGVRSRTDAAMANEVSCKLLCHTVGVVHQSHVERGIEPVFWPEEPAGKMAVPAVLPMARPG